MTKSLATLLTLTAVALVAAPAQAAPLACGDTITADTTLHHDLSGCAGPGLVIGADGVTLNLGGHAITADGGEVGVDNSAGHEDVTIRNGRINGFGVGVAADGAAANALRDLSVNESVFVGILLVDAADSLVASSSVRRNGLDTEGTGLVVFASDGVRLLGNTVADNGDAGIFFGESGSGRLEGNTVTGNPAAGIGVEGDGNEVQRNRLSGNGDDLIVSGDGNVVARNQVTDATGCGVDECGYGISLEGGNGNLIEGNIVVRTVQAGIRAAAFEPEGPPTTDSVLRDNTVRFAGTDGLNVEESVSDTLLDGNTALNAGDDGIDVDSATTTLRDNLAIRSGDLGIEGTSGVTDGGGNRAWASGNPLQCTFVVCG